MNKLFIILLLFIGNTLCAQQQTLLFQKGRKTVSSYWAGMYISFQLHNGEWEKGVIQKITQDSIYIQPVIIIYHLMGTDTITLPIVGFHLTDIGAMPKRGILIDYKNGRWQISRSGGHVHFYWIKSGTLFRWSALAYLGVATVNGMIDKKNKITGPEIAAGAGVFGVGLLLKYLYRPSLKIGKRYHFTVMSV